MQKLEALKIFNLNENFSELEIKKKYRKLILECHPQKYDSEESREEYRKIQEAYNLLISELSINYKVNFGVSEAEIEEFKNEEVKEILERDLDIRNISFRIQLLKNQFDSIDTEKILPFSTPEQGEIYQNWFNQLYWRFGLGQGGEEESWEKDLGDNIRLDIKKKEFWNESKEEYKNSFSEEEWKEWFKKFQVSKSLSELWGLRTPLYKASRKKSIK